MQNISKDELDAYITQAPTASGLPLVPPSVWERIDVGGIETYVGDNIYVIAVVEHKPTDLETMDENLLKAEATVMTYLQSEGFIGPRYFFMGFQVMDLNDFGNL